MHGQDGVVVFVHGRDGLMPAGIYVARQLLPKMFVAMREGAK